MRRSITLGPLEVDAALPREVGPGQGLAGWVALHRRPILWADMERDARAVFRTLMIGQQLRFALAYPIAIGDRLLGVFTLARATPARESAESAAILASLAAQAAVALDHARLYAETTRRLAQTRALLEVAQILNSTLDSAQLLQRVAIKTAQVCRVDRASLEMLEGDRLVPITSQFADGHAEPEMWAAFRTMAAIPPSQVPPQARALETRAPVIVADATRSDELPRAWVDAFRHKSMMVVPLVRQDEVIGVLTLDHVQEVTPFEPWQVDLAVAIGGQLALALDNARLYGEVNERLRETTTLLAVGQALSRPAPLAEQVRRVAREVARALGADMVGVHVLDEDRDRLRPLAGYRVPESLRPVLAAPRIALSRMPLLREAWSTGRATGSPDPHHDPRFDRELVGQLPPHSLLMAPARVHGTSVGGLFLVWWTPGREFSAAEMRLVEGVAAQVGLALENAELARQREIKLKETETLLQVSRALSSTLDLDALLRNLLRRVAGAVEADTVGVFLLDDERGDVLVPRAGYRVPVERLHELSRLRLSTTAHALYAEAAVTRRPVFSADVPADPRVPGDLKALLPHRSQLFVPIAAKDRLIGGFMAVWTDQARTFAASELALMEGIANHAGVAVENARLFAENRRQVEELSVLHELSRAVTGQLDRDALVATLGALAPRVLEARRFVVRLLDPETGELEAVLRVEDGADVRALAPRYPVSVGLGGVVVATGRPIRTDDYWAELARRGVAESPVGGFRCWLGVPMRVGDTTLGVLALSRDEPPFTEGHERLLLNIADLAALALRSARLFEERTRAYGELAAAQDHLVRTEKLRALGEMASGVAHDFNNLLAAILGRAQLLLRRLEDPTLHQWAQVIERAALDGGQTVRRLQEFARVRRDEPLVPVDLNQVVRDALDITQSRWREDALRRGLAIDVRTALAPVPPVNGDAAELREAMTNLILNALDAMPGGGALTIATGATGDEVEITVTDTGTGMPEAVRERIFDPFFTTKGPQGTGLGLSMTYGIVSRHGGRITVDSAEGRGSVFRLVLPAAVTPAVPPPPPARAAEPAPALRCLVVDDEPMVGEVMGDVLESMGHVAVVLTDGAAAIARFEAEPFDAVFTDLAMPGVSGWQVVQAVKRRAPDVPVFVVTGFGTELAPDERAMHGVEAIFAKPLKIDDIMDAVAQVARRRHQPQGENA
jgi:GAF domain-containing protein/ActR/RegA family two-component response regulator